MNIILTHVAMIVLAQFDLSIMEQTEMAFSRGHLNIIIDTNAILFEIVFV